MGETKKNIPEITANQKSSPSPQKETPVRPLLPRQILFAGVGAGLFTAAAVTIFKLPFLSAWILSSLVTALSMGAVTKLQAKKYETYLNHIQQENRNLELLRAKADTDNARKTEFMADMSRRLRTPISVVLGLSRVSLRQNIPDAAAQNLENILSLGIEMLETVNDILDFSKIEAGQMEFTEGRYSLSSLVSDIKEIIDAKLEGTPVTFVQEIDDTIPNFLWGDEMRLRQILLNVTDSALTQTKEEILCLNIRWKRQKDMAFLTIGLSVSNQKVQEKKSLQKNPWADLKALIAKNLAEKMNGSVSFEDAEDGRDNFTVTIPQKILQETPMYGEAKSRLRPILKSPDNLADDCVFPGARVLVIDSSTANLKLIKSLLSPYNMKAEYVLHVPECLERNWAKNYDLIFLDYYMPELNSGEILQYLQKNPKFKTPVIALTANASSETKENCSNWGFADVLAKPIQPEELENCLKQYLSAYLHTGQETGETDNGKIVFTLMPQAEKSEEPEKPLHTPVDKEILDPVLGIENTAGEESFYIEILELYLSEAQEKKELLASYLDEGDMKNYAVQIHAMKSTMRSVGAMKAGELAFDLETHSKKDDLEYVREHHGNVIREIELAEENMRLYLSEKVK